MRVGKHVYVCLAFSYIKKFEQVDQFSLNLDFMLLTTDHLD